MAQSHGKHYVYAAVSAAEVELLKAIAQKDGLSLSNFVRRCINGYLLELGDDSLPMLDEIPHVGRKTPTHDDDDQARGGTRGRLAGLQSSAADHEVR